MSMLNLSLLEDDPFMVEDPEEAAKELSNAPVYWYYVISDILTVSLCFAMMAADSFMILAISKTRQLRSKANKYILYYFILNLISMWFPIFWTLLASFPQVDSFLGYECLCMVFHLDNCVVLLSQITSFGLALDWLLTEHKPDLGRRFQKLSSYSMLSIFSVGLIYVIMLTSECFQYIFVVNDVMFVQYPLMLLFFVACNYSRYRNSEKTSLSLTVANIMICSWLPLYIFHWLLHLTLQRDVLLDVVEATIFLPEWLVRACPLLIIVVLGEKDKHFKMAYKKTMRRGVRGYDDDLEESEEERTTDFTNVTPI